MKPSPQPAKVALIIIATNRYADFAGNLVESADRHFLERHHVEYFLFTDRLPAISSNRPVHICSAWHMPWPYVTLKRYSTILTHREALSSFDFIYYCDADMRFVDKVGPEIFGDRVATLHPGFIGKRGTPETRPESTALISNDTPLQYFVGAFLGGSSKEFLRMADTISANVRGDLEQGIIALWHDESHSNRWFVDNPPDVILDPGYCWVRNWGLPFKPRLEALSKDHEALRSD